MAYASHVSASPQFHFPPIGKPRWPRLRRPLLSGRARALLMMGLMISPAFLSDYIGYGIKRLTYTAAQIAEMRKPDDTMLSRVTMFPVACADPATPAAQRRAWVAVAAGDGWPRYPEAGETCFRLNRSLLGIAGLKTFTVACPTAALSVADRRHWMTYAADRGWTAYPQAGADCVDP